MSDKKRKIDETESGESATKTDPKKLQAMKDQYHSKAAYVSRIEKVVEKFKTEIVEPNASEEVKEAILKNPELKVLYLALLHY